MYSQLVILCCTCIQANYNKLSEICFADCVWDFTSRKVLNSEDTCALNCAEKYLKMNQRISTRFQVLKKLNFCLGAFFSNYFDFAGVPGYCKRECNGSDIKDRKNVIVIQPKQHFGQYFSADVSFTTAMH